MAGKPLSYQQISRLAKARAKEFTIIEFTGKRFLGYRSKEDITTLPPGTLVPGSQNVLTQGAGYVGNRQGYALDGPAAAAGVSAEIDSAFDFQTHNGQLWNMRKWGPNLEFKYVDPSGSVTWQNLMGSIPGTGLIAGNEVNFCQWWDAVNELKTFCLFVNGDPSICEWSGGVGLFASASDAQGQVTQINQTPAVPGSGYAVGDILALGGGAGATAQVSAITNIGITAVTVDSGQYTPSYPYRAGQLLSFAVYAGPVLAVSNCTVEVTSVDANGAVTAISLVSQGAPSPSISGLTGTYTAIPTYCSSYQQAGISIGASAGCTLNVTIGASNGVPTLLTLLTSGSGYSIATQATTGGSGTGCTVAVGGIASNSLTIQGGSATTASELNFHTASGGTLNILGVQYSYSGVLLNTFFSLSADPVAAAIPAGTLVVQAVNRYPNTTQLNGIPAGTWTNDLVASIGNQLYVGSLTNLTVYVSKLNNFKDFTFSSPRGVGDGFTILLDEPPTAIQAQDTVSYIGTKSDYWYQTSLDTTVNSTGGSAQTINTGRVKTTALQGPRSQALTARMKNFIVYVSFETIVNAMGFQKSYLSFPTVQNMSDPIVNDINSYDFTDGQAFYFNYYLYISVPKEGIVLVYNIVRKYWEAPQIMPISRFYVDAAGQLCGHSYLAPESYVLFTGYNDNGNPINAIMAMAYQNAGLRANLKNMNAVYVEGYISSNTTLVLGIKNDFGGSTSVQSFDILGTDSSILFETVSDASLGKYPLGKNPLGSVTDSVSGLPKFRVFRTFPRQDMFEYQIFFQSNDVDQQWEVLAVGDNANTAGALPSQITQ